MAAAEPAVVAIQSLLWSRFGAYWRANSEAPAGPAVESIGRMLFSLLWNRLRARCRVDSELAG